MNRSRVRIGWIAVVAALLCVCGLVFLLPVDVPDGNSPQDGNHAGLINATTTIGQTFTASRDGLHRVEVTLAAEQPDDRVDFTFRIAALPWRQLGEVTRPALDVPVGKVIDFRPGTMKERWYSFEFEPIADSAGRAFFFSMESKDPREAGGVGLLMFFHNRYPLGEAYVNGTPVNAHVVFRAYSKGHPIDLARVLAERLTADKSGFLGSPLTFGSLGLIYILLSGGLVLVVRRAV